MIRRPPRSTLSSSSAAADVYKRQVLSSFQRRRRRERAGGPAMTEPREIADHLEQVEDGLFHWRIQNSGIGGNVSSSQALVRHADCVFVDPVRLEDDLLATLPAPTAVALTARCHQHAAWRYRRELGAEVWLPDHAEPGAAALLLPARGRPRRAVLLRPDHAAYRQRAALRALRVPRGPGGHAAQRRAPARPAVRDPLPRPRGAAHRRPEILSLIHISE